ncbi:MAG: hypothetical protein A2Y81_04830 [Nitrospirae bacterium RBG_13_43_8]|nr:MAG: hypothetical protein A2Y81_04830 [Nitrospirae bacterium RBG_13_43_8]
MFENENYRLNCSPFALPLKRYLIRKVSNINEDRNSQFLCEPSLLIVEPSAISAFRARAYLVLPFSQDYTDKIVSKLTKLS